MKKIISLILIVLLAQGLFSQQLQPGSIDWSFNPQDHGYGNGANDWISKVVEQPDGKLLIGGYFTTYNGIERNRMARLYADGTLDPTFDPGSGCEFGFDFPMVSDIKLFPDGKMLITGSFQKYNGVVVNSVVRLHPDGSHDTSFQTGSGANNRISTIEFEADGKILLGGSFTVFNGLDVNRIVRLNADGSTDQEFQGPVLQNFMSLNVIRSLPDGKLLVGGSFTQAGGTNNNYLVKLMSDGSIDETFYAGYTAVNLPWFDEYPFVYDIYLTLENKYLVTGRLSYSIPGTSLHKGIMLLNPDGSPDPGFIIPTLTPFQGFQPYMISVSPCVDGKFYVTGGFSSFNGVQRRNIARIFGDGTLDQTYEPDGQGTYGRIIIQTGGKLLLTGEFSSVNNIRLNTWMIRLDENSLDLTFNPYTGANDYVRASCIQDDGKILIGGIFHLYNGDLRRNLARLNPDGSTDASFDPGLSMNHPGMTYAIAVQSDGRMLVGGSFTSFNGVSTGRIVRLNDDGSIDQDFDPGTGANNLVQNIRIQADGKIVTAGSFTSFNNVAAGRIVRLNIDGSLDTQFNTGTGANGSILSILLQPDGKILIAGSFTMFNNTPANKIARLNSDGSLDPDFNTGSGIEGGNVLVIQLQNDGKILVGGLFTSYNGIPAKDLVRINSDGSPDETFNPGNSLTRVEHLLVQNDGKMIVYARVIQHDSAPVTNLVRLNSDGSRDFTFESGSGFNSLVYTLALQQDGHIIAGGLFTAYNGIGRNRIARIIGSEVLCVPPLNDQAEKWQVYPNPACGTITLDAGGEARNATVRLYDLNGRVLLEKGNMNGRQFVLDTRLIQPGVIIIETTESTKVERIKFIKSALCD